MHQSFLKKYTNRGSTQLHSIRKKPFVLWLGLIELWALDPWEMCGYWRSAGIIPPYPLSSFSFSPWSEGVRCGGCYFVVVLLWKGSGETSYRVNLTIFMTPVTFVKRLYLLNFLLSFHLIHGSKRAVPINRPFLPLLREVLEAAEMRHRASSKLAHSPLTLLAHKTHITTREWRVLDFNVF